MRGAPEGVKLAPTFRVPWKTPVPFHLLAGDVNFLTRTVRLDAHGFALDAARRLLITIRSAHRVPASRGTRTDLHSRDLGSSNAGAP